MNYNIISVILIVIIVGLLAKMSQTNEHFETLSRLERGKKICKSQKFNPWTLGFPDEDEVKNILNTVLQYINKKLNMNYHLGKLDHVTKETDFEGNVRYLIDFFSYHLDPTQRNDINRRMILDVTKKMNNTLKINMLTVGNAKKYKHPTEIPEMEDNDELIIKDIALQDTHHVIGNINQILDYGIDIPENKKQGKSNQKFQSWILPKGACSKSEIFPCRKQHKWWDINGVHHTDKDNESCKGLDTSATPRSVTAEFEAGHGALLSDKPKHAWLFNKARGRQSSNEPLVGATPVV